MKKTSTQINNAMTAAPSTGTKKVRLAAIALGVSVGWLQCEMKKKGIAGSGF